MVWFKVDDTLAFHEKTVAAGNAAMGLWVRAGSWCAQMLTDGFVPDHMVTALGTKAQAKALTEVGLWVREGNGYRFHGWLEYNPTADEVRADQARKHEAKVAAGRAGGLASGIARRKHTRSSDEADAKQNGSKTKPRPVPTRPSSGYEIEGGYVPNASDTPPPLYSDRCSRHGNDPAPGNCGDCKDVRLANQQRPPLTVVRETQHCWVHDIDYREICNGCEADRKAAS
jgi:hypothetical protein